MRLVDWYWSCLVCPLRHSIDLSWVLLYSLAEATVVVAVSIMIMMMTAALILPVRTDFHFIELSQLFMATLVKDKIARAMIQQH